MTEELNPDKSGSIEDWWDQAHAVKHSLWLTESEGPEIWRALKVANRIKPRTRILNIGVGMGMCTRGLVEHGAKVSVLDISPNAIHRVSDVIDAGYLASRLEELPKDAFDLVISNLVSQHMMDAELEAQLHHVIPSLKAGGLLAMQFSFAWNQSAMTLNNSPEAAKKGAICRTLGRIEAMVDQAEGMISWAQMIASWPEHNIGWYAVHIIRKEDSTFSYADRNPVEGFSKWTAGNVVPGPDELASHIQALVQNLVFEVREREQNFYKALRFSKSGKPAASAVQQLMRELNQTKRARDQMIGRIVGMHHTHSWRVTRPLRAVMRMVRRLI